MMRPDPALLVVALFSRHAAALAWAAERLEVEFGPAGLSGRPFDFRHTRYYEPEMGPGLRKYLLAFERLVGAEELSRIKRRTNELEDELAGTGRYPARRPLNLDPGILTLGKLVLATTKDQAHRVYLGDGIYGESTLFFRDGAFEPWPWTYPDYREALVLGFLKDARAYYRRRLREAGAGS